LFEVANLTLNLGVCQSSKNGATRGCGRRSPKIQPVRSNSVIVNSCS
jgi:hypothetical protein